MFLYLGSTDLLCCTRSVSREREEKVAAVYVVSDRDRTADVETGTKRQGQRQWGKHARALAACLPRQDHVYSTTDKSFRFHNNKFR